MQLEWCSIIQDDFKRIDYKGKQYEMCNESLSLIDEYDDFIFNSDNIFMKLSLKVGG